MIDGVELEDPVFGIEDIDKLRSELEYLEAAYSLRTEEYEDHREATSTIIQDLKMKIRDMGRDLQKTGNRIGYIRYQNRLMREFIEGTAQAPAFKEFKKVTEDEARGF